MTINYLLEVKGKTTDSGRNLQPHNWFEALLRRFLPYKEIGWQDIGEVFYRYTLVKSPWFNLYLHVLDAPNWHPVGCHDHPWWFWTLLLKNGYVERTSGLVVTRMPGELLYRPASHLHDVITSHGTSWSLVLTGPKSRTWGFKSCEA